MYGLFHTPFWNEDDHSFCDFCIDDLNQTKKNIKNTRIAGPIFLVLGLILIIAGIIMRKKSLSDHVAQGTHALSSTGGGVVGYATTGSTVTHQVNNQQPGQPAYPPSQSTYPPPPKFQGQSGAYPPPTQQYPPQRNNICLQRNNILIQRNNIRLQRNNTHLQRNNILLQHNNIQPSHILDKMKLGQFLRKQVYN